jgi:hypothetical protein
MSTRHAAEFFIGGRDLGAVYDVDLNICVIKIT